MKNKGHCWSWLAGHLREGNNLICLYSLGKGLPSPDLEYSWNTRKTQTHTKNQRIFHYFTIKSFILQWFYLNTHSMRVKKIWWLSGKESACNAGATGDVRLIPGLGRSPGGGHGNPLQYSCLENPKDRGARQATVHRVAESDMTEVT